MDFLNVLTKDLIDLSPPVFKDKDELFQHMTRMLKESDKIESEEEFLKALYKREESGSTYVGNGIAIPHGITETVKSASAAFCRCTPFEYQSQDDCELVRLVLVLAVPKVTESKDYIRMLSKLSRLLLVDRFLDVLITSVDEDEIFRVFREEILKL
jgi:fructose-specific phosphotransferase system IIA component